jgi:hypothetical protein
MRYSVVIWVALACVLGATLAFAQNDAVAPDTASKPVAVAPPISCGDFRRNPDGSWSPLHGVTIGDVTISPGSAFQPGGKVAGVDIATYLNAKCVR